MMQIASIEHHNFSSEDMQYIPFCLLGLPISKEIILPQESFELF
jgi:hypothetical protein